MQAEGGMHALLEDIRQVQSLCEGYWAAGWFAGLLLFCSLASLLGGLGFTSPDGVERLLNWRLDDYFWSVLYSIQTAFVRPPETFTSRSWPGEAVKVATMIFGPIFLGLFALALRQRVRR